MSVLGLATLLAGVVVLSPGAAVASGSNYVSGEVLVKLKQVSDLAGVAQTFALDPVPLDQFGSQGSIVVGASEPSDALASFSDFGSWVTVEAPGDSIISAVPGGGTGVWAGTSMASPLVSGEVALVHSLAPTLSTPDLVSRITRSAVQVNSQVRLRADAAAAVAQTAHN